MCYSFCNTFYLHFLCIPSLTWWLKRIPHLFGKRWTCDNAVPYKMHILVVFVLQWLSLYLALLLFSSRGSHTQYPQYMKTSLYLHMGSRAKAFQKHSEHGIGPKLLGNIRIFFEQPATVNIQEISEIHHLTPGLWTVQQRKGHQCLQTCRKKKRPIKSN